MMETARSLGAYYTPSRLADPLCRWAVRKPEDAVLDPSCGEGAFLARAAEVLLSLGAPPRKLSDQVAGVEVDPATLARAHGALLSRHPGLRWSRIAEGDFFKFSEDNLGRVHFDAVIGNPPFLRTQGQTFEAKQKALRVAHACGAALRADASTWAPFVAAAAGFVRPGGRLAMVVPREALFVNYAKPLLQMLQRRFGHIDLIALDEFWFEGALVKVAVLLAEGSGPGVLRLREAHSLDRIGEWTATAPAPSWIWTRLPSESRAAAAEALESPDLPPMTDAMSVTLGIVTGDKDFFLLPRDAQRTLPWEYLLPAVSRPAHLAGSTLTPEDLDLLDRRGEPNRLLCIPSDYAGGRAALDAYIAEGTARGIHLHYKCRTRKPWYSVRRVLEPSHALLGYLVKRRPRFAANAAEAQTTNNLHRVTMAQPWVEHASLIAAAFYNAATMLSVELLGRVAAGGVLKIEPGDISKIHIIAPERLIHARGARKSAQAIDQALRRGADEEAYALADELAYRALGWKPPVMARLRRAQRDLCALRLDVSKPNSLVS